MWTVCVGFVYCIFSRSHLPYSSSLLPAVHPGDRCHHSSEHATMRSRLSCLETTPFFFKRTASDLYWGVGWQLEWRLRRVAAESWGWRRCAAVRRIGADAPRALATRNHSLRSAHSRSGRLVLEFCGDADAPAGIQWLRLVDWSTPNPLDFRGKREFVLKYGSKQNNRT